MIISDVQNKVLTEETRFLAAIIRRLARLSPFSPTVIKSPVVILLFHGFIPICSNGWPKGTPYQSSMSQRRTPGNVGAAVKMDKTWR